MTSNRKKLPDKRGQGPNSPVELLKRLPLGPGFWTLVLVLGVISFIVTFEWGKTDQRRYSAGEVAEIDIAADRSFRFQDNKATKARREAAQKAQPLICILNLEPLEEMHRKVQELFINVNKSIGQRDEFEALRLRLSEEVGEEVPPKQFAQLADPDVQKMINTTVLPWLDHRMREGVVSDVRVLSGYPGGVVVRDLLTGQETLKPGTQSVSGVRDVNLDLSLMVRSLPDKAPVKRLITTILGSYILPTLTPNYEATAQSASDAARTVHPVVVQVMAGEVIVRQGEKITTEQLVKLQGLWQHNQQPFRPLLFLGVWACSVILASGLFFSTNLRSVRQTSQKDLVFMALLLLFTTLVAKAFYVVGFALVPLSASFTPGAQSFAVPAAGAAGIAAMAISGRRYYAFNLLLAFFCTMANKGGLGLFIFYLCSTILCTMLVTDSQKRKDVVLTLVPMVLGMLAIWYGATMVQGGLPNRFLAEGLAVLLGAFMSMIFIFAITPVVEMLFGYTTRFVLMELMNQEHPAIQQLMLNAPGTYHHSIIISNMVELAAKSIGAHSLLCRVGALYHDIGKTEKPGYFIENQFHGINPHDRLTPAMSALVLISHVKRGTELAQQYKLGEDLTAIIREHHGTSVIRYFYHKAKNSSSNPAHVKIEDFQYDGPRPQTREAALIMLADVVEASSRVLADPTPSRIRAHVSKTMRGILSEGQLDAADLTFRDLDKVADSFTLILTGIFHKRIEYPDKVPAKPELPPELRSAPQENYHASEWIRAEDGQSRPVRKKAPKEFKPARQAGGPKPELPAAKPARHVPGLSAIRNKPKIKSAPRPKPRLIQARNGQTRNGQTRIYKAEVSDRPEQDKMSLTGS